MNQMSSGDTYNGRNMDVKERSYQSMDASGPLYNTLLLIMATESTAHKYLNRTQNLFLIT